MATENCASVTDFAAFEKRLRAVDRDDYVENGDHLGGACEPETAARTLRGHYQSRLLQLREELGDVFDRRALEFRQIAAARLLSLRACINEIKQAVESVFNA